MGRPKVSSCTHNCNQGRNCSCVLFESKDMKNWLKFIFPSTPSPLELATRELVQAERSKLEAETAQEYAAALVSYNAARIARLTQYIHGLTKVEVK